MKKLALSISAIILIMIASCQQKEVVNNTENETKWLTNFHRYGRNMEKQ